MTDRDGGDTGDRVTEVGYERRQREREKEKAKRRTEDRDRAKKT